MPRGSVHEHRRLGLLVQGKIKATVNVLVPLGKPRFDSIQSDSHYTTPGFVMSPGIKFKILFILNL